MNERMMQFRIGMFVIVAGLVLTMLIVWFGESPSLFRDHGYLTVRFIEAPGIAVGIPVRKSGIRIGEVSEIQFDRRPGSNDGVLVTMALERQFPLAAGSVPRLSRALIGDVSIDMLPGDGQGDLILSPSPGASMAEGRVIEGQISPDPANALAAATTAFERAGETLGAIDEAAKAIAAVAERVEEIPALITTWRETGTRAGALAERLDRVVADYEPEIGPTISSLRTAADSVNQTLDPATRQKIQESAANLAAGTGRLNKVLADIGPLAADLGAVAGVAPSTSLGQSIFRLNRIVYEVGLLTAALPDRTGRGLNPNGSLQRLVLRPDLYDNILRTSVSIQEVFVAAKPMVRSLNEFAERIARDPSAISRGALQPR